MWLLIVLLLADTSRAFSIALAPAESVWVTVEGVGDPVVLIPGLFGSAFGYRTVLPRLVEAGRSEEHTSELQSLRHLVCRLLLEKKKFASRLTYVSGNAVKNAASNVKQQLFEQAGEMLEANPQDLVSRDGKIFVKGAECKSIAVADVAGVSLFRHYGAPIVGSGSFDADSVLPDSCRFGNESGAYNYGAQAAHFFFDPAAAPVIYTLSLHDALPI